MARLSRHVACDAGMSFANALTLGWCVHMSATSIVRILTRVGLSVAGVMVAIGCVDFSLATSPCASGPVSVAAVKLSPRDTTLRVGDTMKLQAMLAVPNGQG